MFSVSCQFGATSTVSLDYLVQHFPATSALLAWIMHLPPPSPPPFYFFTDKISVTGALFYWCGSSWLEGAGLPAMGWGCHWLCQKRKPLDIAGKHLYDATQLFTTN